MCGIRWREQLSSPSQGTVKAEILLPIFQCHTLGMKNNLKLWGLQWMFPTLQGE